MFVILRIKHVFEQLTDLIHIQIQIPTQRYMLGDKHYIFHRLSYYNINNLSLMYIYMYISACGKRGNGIKLPLNIFHITGHAVSQRKFHSNI